VGAGCDEYDRQGDENVAKRQRRVLEACEEEQGSNQQYQGKVMEAV
jgi:hypothetical protein